MIRFVAYNVLIAVKESPNPESVRYLVMRKDVPEYLGAINWHQRSREFHFYPHSPVSLSVDMLRDLQHICETIERMTLLHPHITLPGVFDGSTLTEGQYNAM